MTRPPAGLASLLAGTLAVAACSLIPNPLASGAALAAELNAARTRWASKAIDDYQLTLQVYCLCPFQEPVRVTVEDGLVTSVTTLDGTSANPADVEWYPLRVESAFRTVEENLVADEIEVTFDPDFGFPAHVSANPDVDMHDEEINFDVTDFVAGS